MSSSPILALSTNNHNGSHYETIVVSNTMDATATGYSKSENPRLSIEASKYLNACISSPDLMSTSFPNDREKERNRSESKRYHEGCDNYVQRGGECTKRRRIDTNVICECIGCDKDVHKGGVCKEHWATSSRKCSHEGCNNLKQRGGVCRAHRTILHVDSNVICERTGCDKDVHKGGLCKEHWATSSRKCYHEGCDNYVQRDGVCSSHRTILHLDADVICECTGCDKDVHKGGVCNEHWAADSRKCSYEGCDNYKQRGGLCRAHHTMLHVDADVICERTGCDKDVHKGGLCKEHWATSSHKCSHEGCDKFVAHLGGLCRGHHSIVMVDPAEKTEVAEHIAILAESLSSIFCRLDYEYARSSANWGDLKSSDNSDNRWSPPLLPNVRFIATTRLVFDFFVQYSINRFPTGQDHSSMKLSVTEIKWETHSCPHHGSKMNPELRAIRPLRSVISDVHAERLQIDSLRVPFERRLQNIYLGM